MLGAGSGHGYFGERLVEAGVDVTSLARPARAASLQRDSVAVPSPLRDMRSPGETMMEAREPSPTALRSRRLKEHGKV